MKRINKLGIFAVVLLLFVGISGCDDFLQYEKYGPGDSESFWKTEADLEAALNGFYIYADHEEVGGRGHYWYENCSDNMITGRTNANADAVKNFAMGASTGGYFHQHWEQMFRVIAKANDVLRYVPKMTGLPQSKIDNAIGQAYFFRAYAYLWECPWLADNRAGLPIMTENTPANDLDQPRAPSVMDNYKMIVEDFRKAADLLPSWSEMKEEDYGRPYKTAAWAFCARAALYAAEWDAATYFPIVIEMCEKIEALTGGDKRELHYLDPINHQTSYGLTPSNFSDLFRMENNFSKEYIFSILGIASGYGPKFHGMSFYNGGFAGYNTWGYYAPTAELYEAFETGDTRRDATILAPGQRIKHPTSAGLFANREIRLAVPGDLGDVKQDFQTSLINRKMHSIYEIEGGWGVYYSTSGDGLQNCLGTVVMRYADVLLMHAEALIWTQGEGNAKAKELINQVRVRAGLPANSDATKAQLKNERRCELAFEFLPSRHYDLVRWGDAKDAYAKPLHGYVVKFKTVGDDQYVFDPSEKKQVWPARTFDPVKNHVFPIHTTIMNKSTKLVQNAGYN